jgi:hypothetical protein
VIVFITPLTHPSNCRSYERIGTLLNRTLLSVCRQTDGDFAVLVVCNRKPTVACADPRVNFIEVPFAAASPEPGPVSDIQCVWLDKGAKLAVGLLRAQSFHPDHVMFVDFDDLVNRDIAAFVNARSDADGWYLDRGYVYWEGSARITPVQGFNKLCGTSNILAFRLVNPAGRIGPDLSREAIVEALGEFYIKRILGGHPLTAGYLSGQGYAIAPLPFYGAIWIRGTGENVWVSRGFPSLAGQKVTNQIRDLFNLEVPATSFVSELVASCRQVLQVWREAQRAGSLRPALIDTFWQGPRRMIRTMRGKTWRL